ncbi:aminomethyl-transferring glycine dehydrogenase subunit GcvPB [Clostridium sp. CM028]|uniref:aminomethyl-transferring glycine dehydrogenase subunit GcvPB n=1 Tax=unclassified Clostridium TaxID=2614128 RepID=UPI001C0BE795|nr:MULTISPECIES: aminomethyl-transferring glycine dehydrogenase subunit GcvPB [unclassified Clostridium]MBU3090906.1 aminomethyl-transferring glycine dehydrogenase subunit GcvPB [Clostridium sp. CF011]MBW9144526.1 aminomethyl-transferring glycine dehydrogenase subunit GcvPB [Clostridium sp. CM027]MBW9147944.1 aminomethyl-transferring glycine dehydrogenase subunit GcvPB [Clostridium sp. CM028]UVE40706.1 aminomethyl-transferring glycine dehydrogenase subunit GcvPB [Clostridium sp. CM027]WAG69674
MKQYNKLIFEISKEGRRGYTLPCCDVESIDISEMIPEHLLSKKDISLPEVSEVDVIRHFTLLSNKNYGVDTGFYPLGSCTMKYNPKINEDMASMTSFTQIHPYQSVKTVQGSLQLMYELSEKLAEISGMDQVSLQPAAGAHGELTGLMIIKAFHENKGDFKRKKIIVPDSAHGTNPASASVAGFEIVEVKSNEKGSVDLDSLKSVLNDEIAGLMLTNPNTLGLFDENIKEITNLVHEAGGLVYYDGANLNAIMGIARPGDMGFDVVHMNLHKTFSTPHGGGGPGSGPVGVKKELIQYLPVPIIEKIEEKFVLNYDKPLSIGKVKSFYGNFGVLVKAYSYILSMGAEGLKKASEMAVLNANYMKSKLKNYYYLPIDRVCKHEFVLGGLKQGPSEVTTLDIAKRLLDYGYHPPTIYFPTIVENAIMIEPTETESLETMDDFIEAMINISEEAIEDPQLLKDAPYDTLVRRLDEVRAARYPVLKYTN